MDRKAMELDWVGRRWYRQSTYHRTRHPFHNPGTIVELKFCHFFSTLEVSLTCSHIEDDLRVEDGSDLFCSLALSPIREFRRLWDHWGFRELKKRLKEIVDWKRISNKPSFSVSSHSDNRRRRRSRRTTRRGFSSWNRCLVFLLNFKN